MTGMWLYDDFAHKWRSVSIDAREQGALAHKVWLPVECSACGERVNIVHPMRDGRKLCRACYDAAQPWRVDAGTRENYESALGAIRGGGYGASAEMIESYVNAILQRQPAQD